MNAGCLAVYAPDALGEIYFYSLSATELRVAAAIFATGFPIFTLLLKVAVPISQGEFVGEGRRDVDLPETVNA